MLHNWTTLLCLTFSLLIIPGCVGDTQTDNEPATEGSKPGQCDDGADNDLDGDVAKFC